METKKYALPEETAKLFAMAPNAPVEFYSVKLRKHIDINTLTPTMAQKLIDSGCKEIVALPADAPAEDTASKTLAQSAGGAAKTKPAAGDAAAQ